MISSGPSADFLTKLLDPMPELSCHCQRGGQLPALRDLLVSQAENFQEATWCQRFADASFKLTI